MNAVVEELFHQVVDLPLTERTQYFADHGVDEDTRREVEALLAFEPDASAALVRDIGLAAMRALPGIESGGPRCGPYRLLNVLGRGGMGAVYLAERADGEVTQRVAVKLLPPGAGESNRERFLQERQILATLAHPNIARMLDAGHIDHGRPFLAMEYVEGQPIDMFAAELALRQKIGLFLKVCAAVAYLHRHLIVHRDLKPNNVLVTADGEPKLLDFGIAKLLDVSADMTMTGMRMLTPTYASPEQVTGGAVSTATDVYSLGALLYRLLTGRTTHDFDGCSADAAASLVATQEITPPRTRAPELKGDLDAILTKALRRDPLERYANVEQFADDLRAYLESRPVRARAGNRLYVARRFVRRYWIPVAAGASVIASLAAGLYAANRERVIAERRFADVRQLSTRLFDIDKLVGQLSGSTKARQLIVDTSLEYLRRLTAEVHDDPVLALETATAYISVAQVEGVTNGANLGQLDFANRDLTIAMGLVEPVLKSEPGNRTALLRAAQIANDRAWLAWQDGRTHEATALAKESLGWMDRLAPGAADRENAPLILNIYTNLAHKYMYDEQFAEALRLCTRGMELASIFGRAAERSGFLDIVALARRYQGDLGGALEAARESVRLQEAASADLRGPRLNFAMALIREGWILGEPNAISLGRSEEAIAVLDRAFTITDKFVHDDALDESSRSRLFLAAAPLADLLRRTDARRGLAVYDHALADMDDVPSRFLRLRAIHLLAGSTYALRSLGRATEARARLDRAFETLKVLNIYPAATIEVGAEAQIALAALADHEAATGSVVRGITLYQDLLQRIAAGGAKPEASLQTAVALSNMYRSLGTLHRRHGALAEAAEVDEKRLRLWQVWNQTLPNNAFVAERLGSQFPLR